MRKMGAVCKGNKAYKWFLFFLSFCMLLGSTTAHPFTVKAATSGQTDYIIRFWHADGSFDADEDVTGSVMSGNSVGIDSDYIKDLAFKENDRPIEQFVSFSVAAGHEAVTVDDADQSVTINYRSDVHLVKVHVFYETIKEAVGENFGTKFDEKSAEIDTRIGTESEGDLNGKKIYNTAAGLHTEKTATPVLNGDSEDGRTFDVKLESWFAGQNAADVGLILDASGSMAFASTLDASDENLRVYCDPKIDDIPLNQILKSEQVNTFLNSKATDNSSLSYSDYNYYVYDDRDTTEEFVPLGYWDGKADGRHSATENAAKRDLTNGLVGLYHFENNLENSASKTAGLVEGKVIGKAAGSVFSSDAITAPGNLYGKNSSVGGNGSYLIINEKEKGNDLAEKGNILLGTLPDSEEFTISFAVKGEGKSESGDGSEEQDILFMGRVGTDYTEGTYYGVSRGGQNSSQRLRFWEQGSQRLNNNRVFLSEEYYGNELWRIVTYVVKGTSITVYINGGEPKDVNQTTATLTKLRETMSLIIGGTHTYTEKQELYLDELYVYDRALSDSEVKELSDHQRASGGLPKVDLTEGLAGEYHLNGDLKNDAPDVLGKAEGTWVALPQADGYPEIAQGGDVPYATGGAAKDQYFQLFDGKGTAPQGNVLLDAQIEDPQNFTVSFAVKTNNDDNNKEGNIAVKKYQDILYVGDLEVSSRRQFARFGNDGANALRAVLDSDNNSSNDFICRSGSHAFSKTEWHILTFVVNKGEASCYIDGLNKTSKGGQIGADFTGQQRVIIGGPDPYTTGVSLDVDEVYIYNRALNDAEVEAVSTLSKSEIKATGIPKTGSSYVNVSGFDEGKLSTDVAKRAGWYYVNSTSTVKKMESFGTAKELHPVLNSMLKVETDGGWDETATMFGPKSDGVGEDATFEDGPEEGEGGPCLFYIDDQHFLHCIFSADNKCLWDSYVYQKGDDERIKAEELQHALGRFLVELHDSSPQSYVSAVRFSTSNFTDLSKLVMLDWTNDPAESIDIMALKRGDGTFFGNDDGQYNYALTGGTYTKTGVQAFNDYLKNKSHRTEEDVKAKKYLILFTDGLDDDVKEDNESEINKTNQYISALKAEGYTIYTVLLMGGSGSDTQKENRDRAVEFLQSLASEKEYFYPANTSSELEGAFNKILQSINFDLKGYTVRDTIDPRFDLVAYTEKSEKTGALSAQKLIRLGAGGKIRMIDLPNAGSLPETSQELAQPGTDLPEGGQRVYFKSSTQEARSAMLKWDNSNGLYYLEWTNQTIPGCAVGADSLYVWDSTITLRAKDDFLGGNGVLTNGNGEKQNYVYRPGDANASSGTVDMNGAINEDTGEFTDDYPSKGFPRTSVNVKVLEPVMGEGEKTIYLGENIDPEAILKALGGTMDTGSFKGEEPDVFAQYPGSVYYWEYLERYAKKEGIADLIREKWFGAENPGTLEIPYFYLPNTAETNQTGSADAHEKDQIGILTYQLMDGDETGPLETSIAPYVTKDTTEKKYTLKVTYSPLQLSGEGSTAAGDGSAMRDPENKTLIKEEGKAYQTSKAPVGEEQTENKSADGIYVVKIVKGELVLKMRIKATDFSYLQEHVPKTEGQETHRIIKYAAKVERTYSTTAAGGEPLPKDGLGSLAGTYEASIDLDSAETYPRVTEIENGYSVEYVEVNAHLVPETNTEKGGFIAGADESETEKFREYLPIGTYTLTKDEENTVTLAPFIFNDIDKLEIDNDRDRNPMLFSETGSLIPAESDLNDYEAPDPKQKASFQLGTGGTVKPDDSIWPVTPAGLSTASAGTGAASTKEDETLADYLMDRLGIWLISGELQLGNLKISKTVDTAIDPEKKQDPTEFTFSLDLYQYEPEDESKIGEVPRLTGNYSYQIYQKNSVEGGKDETVGAPGEFDASKTIEFTLKDGQYIVIEELPAGAYYTVTEQSKDGYTASIVKTAGAVAGTASIAGTAETIDGVSASGTISDNEQAEVAYTNTYSAEGELLLPVIKKLTGRPWMEGDTFTFRLQTKDTNTFNAVEGGDITLPEGEFSVKEGNPKSCYFDITISDSAEENSPEGKGAFNLFFHKLTSADKPYKFEISELSGGNEALTYADEKYEVEITVQEKTQKEGEHVGQVVRDGKLDVQLKSVTKVKATGETEAVTIPFDPVTGGLTFTNVYNNSGSISIPVTKVLTGRDWTDEDAFTIELIATGEAMEAVASGKIKLKSDPVDPVGTQAGKASVTIKQGTPGHQGSFTIEFAGLDFSGATGNKLEFPFVIKEVLPESNPYQGVQYDITEYSLTVTVTDNGDGTLDAKVTSVTPVEDAEWDQTTGVLALTFTNIYSESGVMEWPPKVSKTLEGRAWDASDKFTFKLTPTGDVTLAAIDAENIVMPEGADPQDHSISVQLDQANTTKAFDNITFKAATEPEGEYEFTISEAEPAGAKDRVLNGITYSDTKYTQKVKVTSDGKGNLTAVVTEVTSSDDIDLSVPIDALPFTNTYRAAGQIEIPVTKVLTGRDWTDEDAFTIELTAKDEAKAAVSSDKIILQADSVDTQEGKASVTIKQDTPDQKGSFKIEFADIDFSSATGNKLEFPFVIKEVLPSQANGENSYQGVQYDITEYDLTVTVTDNGDGTLDAKVTSVTPVEDAEWDQTTGTLALTFTNIYSESGVMEWPPKVSKTLEGRAWDASDIFTFKLTPTGDVTPAAIDDGKIVMPGNADPQDHSISVQLDQANTTKAFDNITFKAATEPEGEYEFTISEAEPEGAEGHVLNGITYSDTVYTLKVKVTSDGKGNLTAVVTGVTSSDGTVLSVPIDALPFTNTYRAVGQIEIPVTKVLTGRDWTDEDAFTIELTAKDEAKAAVSSDKIKLQADSVETQAGKASVTIKQATPDQKGSFKIEFADLDFSGATGNKLEFPFVIKELLPLQANEENPYQGVQYDTTEYSLTVTVTDNGNGTLDVTVEDEEGNQVTEALTFTNTYTDPTFTPVSVDLPVKKILDGRDWQEGDAFTFTLQPESDYGDAVELPGTSVSVGYAEGDDEHTAWFDSIWFKEKGTYYFTVTEEIPEGAEEPQLLMTDVISTQSLTIELPEEELEETETEETETEETETGETETEATETEETETEETETEETQSEETQPEGTQPEETQPEEMQPEETQPEGTQSEETQPEGTQSEETQPGETQSVESQSAEVGARFTYETVYSVEEISSDLMQSSLPEDGLQDELSENVVENSAESEDSLEQPLETQTVSEESGTEPEEIETEEKEEQSPFTPMGLLNGTNEDGGTVKSYGVMTYSRTKYTVKVEVTAVSGALNAAVSITDNGKDWNGSEPMTFTNRYREFQPPFGVQSGAEFPVSKELVGRAWKVEDEFRFEIKLESAEFNQEDGLEGVEAVILPESPIVIKGIEGFEGTRTKTFGNILFNRAGVYVFSIREINDGNEGILYDTTQFTLTVTATLNGEGDLDIELSGVPQDGLKFVNYGEPEEKESESESQPSEPESESQPSEPESEPQPSEPESESQPSEPESEPQPSEPETRPNEPESQPSEPQTQPSEPETQLSVSAETGSELQTETPSVDSTDAMGIQNERDTGEKSAQTGDESDILIAVYVSLMVSAGSIIAAILQRRRKKDNR